MIDKIGPRRATVLFVLIGAIAVLAVANYLFLRPKADSTKLELDGVRNETSVLKKETEKMRADLAVIEKQKLFFDSITKMGFFNEQDRLQARQRFETMQQLSKIISAKYEIRAATIVPDEAAEKTGYVIMDSPIKIDLSAIDDLDVYRFIYYLNYGFPGHITIRNVSIERKAELTPTVLKNIGSGLPTEIITATMDLQWRTMAKKESVDASILAPPTDPQAVGSAQ